MKALLLTEPRQLELADTALPGLEPDTVLVRVRACGICGSDVHGYDGSSGRRIPPLIMGHEAAGVVERVGSEVTRFAVGDRVTFDSTVYCGRCAYCQRGEVNLCDERQVLGVSCGEYRRHGAFAEFVAVPARIVYRLPDGLPFEHAAMIEAVSVAVHAVARTPLPAGASTIVVGSGMIGLLVIQALRVSGAREIIAVDLSNERLELANQLGATVTVNAENDDPLKVVQRVMDGREVDAAFEVVGTTPTVQTAIAAVRKGGSVTLVGNIRPTVEVPLQAIVTRELTLYGCCASQGEYPRCMELMASNQIDVRPLITACVPLAEGPAWFERLYAHEPGLMKVVLQP